MGEYSAQNVRKVGRKNTILDVDDGDDHQDESLMSAKIKKKGKERVVRFTTRAKSE